MTAPDGWLSLAGLEWLRDGSNVVGSAGDADVRFPEGRAPSRIGTITVEEGRARFRGEPGVEVRHDGQPVEELELRPGRDGMPTTLELGSIRFHLIDRDGSLAVRIRDPENPARLAFRGIEHWPVDLRWRKEARFEPREPVTTAIIAAVAGPGEEYRLPGWLAFDHEGGQHRLEVFEEGPDDDYLVVFADGTTGVDTYEGGRFLYVRRPGPSGVAVIDFNRAYNPPCVFTPFATCPLPPPDNRLPFRVEAGEWRYAGPS